MSWRETYESLIGRTLAKAFFLPIPCDTPAVVEGMGNPSLWYSGAFSLAFADGHEVVLTWDLHAQILVCGPLLDFDQVALDRISIKQDEPWLVLFDSTLRGVSLFTAPTVTESKIVAARHDIDGARGQAKLWVCTYDTYYAAADEGDDLLVSVEAPKNASALVLVETIGAG